jgi:hypothetical protein
VISRLQSSITAFFLDFKPELTKASADEHRNWPTLYLLLARSTRALYV